MHFIISSDKTLQHAEGSSTKNELFFLFGGMCSLFFGPAQLHSDLNLWPLPAYKESLLQNSGSADCPIQKMFLRQLFKPKT